MTQFEWTEEMTPEEREIMLRRGPADLGGMREARRFAPAAGAQLGTYQGHGNPDVGAMPEVLDYILNLISLFGPGLSASRAYGSAVGGMTAGGR